MIYDSDGGTCGCGHDAIFRQHVRYSYPRDGFLPEAADPWRVHGGGYSIRTCGNPGCAEAAIAGCRVQIIDDSVLLPHAWLSSEQIDGLELEIAS